MRSLPRTLILAAALLAPAAAATSACGDSDGAAPAAPKTAAAAGPSLDAALARGRRRRLPRRARPRRRRPRGPRARGRRRGHRHGRALRPDDRFRAGSITKSFVATVALQLVGEGRLSLRDTVEQRLPGVLPYGEHVTLRQLLNLTSGIPTTRIRSTRSSSRAT